MRKGYGWKVLVVGMLVGGGVAPQQAAAAASDAEVRALEDRVRAIERKMTTDEKAVETEDKSIRERIEGIEQQVKDAEKTIADKLGIDLHAQVLGEYLYNINNPSSGFNSGRVFDNDANSFTLQDAAIFLQRNVPDENLGFFLSVDFGKVAAVVGSGTCWNHTCDSSEQTNSVELRDAYITYRIPVGDGINLKAGKFVTLLGYEILPIWTNFNPNVSNSFLFGYAIAFTHTGVLANFPIGDMVTVDMGIVNGWDNVVDNNSGKSFLGGFGVTPADFLSMYFSGTYGPEQPDNGHSKRGVVTGVFTVKPAEMVTLIFEGDYGNETDLVGPNQTESALWYGFAGYAVVQATERLGFALRTEVFVDSDGTRGLNSIPNPAVVNGETVWEITPTVAYQVTQGLLWRAEYRHDNSNKPIFQRDTGFVNGQDTIATELIYAF